MNFTLINMFYFGLLLSILTISIRFYVNSLRKIRINSRSVQVPPEKRP
jgi:uncharacterized metal-binding protein